MEKGTGLTRSLLRRWLAPDDRRRLQDLQLRDAGYGYDSFGLHPDWVGAAIAGLKPLYQSYFRVTSHGADAIPAHGPAILASNHSGGLPVDGAMLWMDVIAHTHPPRVPRPVSDLFVPMVPFVGLAFARAGVVAGTRANVRRLLEDGELVMIFPEGSRGVAKLFRDRYRLQAWNVGHAELAIRHRVPVIPVAIVGAEEQWPVVGRIEWLHPFGAPHVPVMATPLPMPVHYHIHYGAPLPLHASFPQSSADDPEVQAQAAGIVRDAVASLIERGLRERPGVFT